MLRDIQEQTIESLRKEIIKLKRELEAKDTELQEIRSLVFILLDLLGNEIVINQDEHKDLISEIFNEQVGLEIEVEDDGRIIKLKKVYLV
jgi:hypothetical protein